MSRRPRPELHPAAVAKPDLGDLPFELTGCSVAGVMTWLALQPWSVGFDCGAVPPELVRCRTLVITHGHMDHAGGLATWLAMRRLNGMRDSVVYAPEEICDVLRAIVTSWEQMHRNPFEWQLIPMKAGDEAMLSPELKLVALEGDHVIPTRAWAIYKRSSKLKRSLHGLDGRAIAARKRAGEEVNDVTWRPMFALTGDSRATTVRREPVFLDAAVAVVECSFLDDRYAVERAQHGGHTHLDELLEVPWNNQVLVPYHVSQRYGVNTARSILMDKLGSRLAAHVALEPLLPPASIRLEPTQ